MDTSTEGYAIAWPVILIMSLISAVFFLVVISLGIRSFSKKVVTGREALIGSVGEVISYSPDHCVVQLQGEIWNAKANQPLQRGQKVKVTQVIELSVNVEPISGKSSGG